MKKERIMNDKCTIKDFNIFLQAFNDYKDKCNKKSKYRKYSNYYLAILNNSVSIEMKPIGIELFPFLGYFNDLGDCQRARELFQNDILKFDIFGYWDKAKENDEKFKGIKKLREKLNLGKDNEENRYYIVISDSKINTIKEKSSKNLITKFGYYYSVDDCWKVIEEYQEEFSNYIK